MKKLLQPFLNVRTLIYLIGTLVTVYFLPRTTTSTYLYEKDRPWNYSLLTAPFDIPIHLDSLSIKAACDSVAGILREKRKKRGSIDFDFPESRIILDGQGHPVEIKPYERNVATKIIEDFTVSLSQVEGVSADRRRRITDKVRELFRTGVVDENTYNDIMTGRLPKLRIVADNVMTTTAATPFRSPMRAYEWLKEQLPADEYQHAIESSRLASMLSPNIVLDRDMSERLRHEQYQKVSVPIGVIQQGERIIDRGDIVTAQLYTVLRTYEQMQAERGSGTGGNNIYAWLAKFLYVGLLFALLAGFLHFFRPRLERNIKAVTFLVGIITVFSLFSFIMGTTFTSGLYIVPFTMVAIMVLVFFDGRTALFTLLTTVLISAVMASYQLEFIFMQFVAGVTAINSLKELSRRSQLLRTALLVFVVYSLAYVAVNVMTSGSFSGLTGRMFGFCAINVVFVSFAYVLIFVFERMFGFTSVVAMVELSDINHPVLRELSKECPGTFQHSMAVSNLAAEAALKVGANVQLVRAGALYHDIGKIDNPAFFTENQHGVNPHDALEPEQSARIITGHVTDGNGPNAPSFPKPYATSSPNTTDAAPPASSISPHAVSTPTNRSTRHPTPTSVPTPTRARPPS